MADTFLNAFTVAAALVFLFITGFHDGGNVIATVIGSRSMTPRRAVCIAVTAEVLGVALLGTAVARTMVDGIIKPEALDRLSHLQIHAVVTGALAAAIIWKLVTWVLGLPASGSHSLIGGLLGAGLAASGLKAAAVDKLVWAVLAPMLLSPLLGAVGGFLLFSAIRTVFASAHRSINHFFGMLQNFSLAFLAAGHGSNDAQKVIGVIMMALATGPLSGPLMEPPMWVIPACAAAIALGLSTGGMRIVKTVGFGIARLEPVHSFASQLTASSIIVAASIMGGPVSTTQVISSSVMGVGAAGRFTGVRWPIAAHIAYAWFATVPASALLGAVWYFVFGLLI